MSLDLGTKEINELLEECVAQEFKPDVLIIDPRWKAIARDSNQDEVVRAFCVNLDAVIRKYDLTVVVVHHEGVATPSDKAGKGSTVFEAWLDGWMRIAPFGENANVKKLDIWSRDSERQCIGLEFDYPIHRVKPELIAERKAKTEQAKGFIEQVLQNGSIPEADVKFAAIAAGNREYAFWRARKEMVAEGRLTVCKAGGQGNRKMLVLGSKDPAGVQALSIRNLY